ncbi:MAG: type I restriction endonuclease subunit R [Deltaproteobacteria bacterium]|nr:type I restriction endonuclease subunit R [Deltaproteobacteria bacterium]
MTEFHTTEWPASEFLGTLGFSRIASADQAILRDGDRSVILRTHLVAAIQRINGVDEDTVNATYNDLLRLSDNGRWLQYLRGGHSRKVSGELTKKTIRIIDLKTPANNTFSLATQFRVQSEQPRKPDIVLFINGIPVVVIECKKPVPKKDKNNEAIEQILQYERDIPRLFLSNAFNVVTDGVNVLYGATGAPAKHWGTWRDPWPKTPKDFGDDAFKIGLWSLLEPRRLLDLIAHFIVFETNKSSGRVVKKICRYQQYRAVNKMVARVQDAKLKRGLVWHTQGSGKSLTMVYGALKLKHDLTASGRDLENPNLLVVTDRKQLDDQISKTFVACGLENPVQVESMKDLHAAVRAATHGVTLLSTIHKFKGSRTPVPHSDRWIVLVDECHRTQEEDLGAFMRATFPDATFFGFTGTPVKKNDKNTFENFGVKGEGYLDRYSIDDAVADGATVPIHYASRMTEWQVEPAKIDMLFDQWFSEEPPEVVEAIKKRGVTQDLLAKHHRRVELIAADIWAHYREFAKPDGLKAQIVAVNREGIILYKRALDRVIAKTLVTQGVDPEEARQKAGEYSRCVYSPNQEDAKDSPDERIQALRLDLRRHALDQKAEEEALKNFNKLGEQPTFLIVCDKLLTGFDAPIEGVMYLDSPLTDHNLLQAIARTNRVWDEGEKSCGMIVDYIGVSKRLDQALSAYRQEDVGTAMRDMEGPANALRVAHRDLVKACGSVKRHQSPNARDEYNALREHLGSLDQWLSFKRLFLTFKDAYSYLCPDPRVLEYQKDLKWFVGFIEWATVVIEKRESMSLATYSAKIRQMIEEHLDVTGIKTVCKLKKITDPDFWDDFALAAKKKISAEEILTTAARKATEVRQAVKERVAANELRYEKFSELVEAAIRKYEENIISAAELLNELDTISKDLVAEDDAYKKTGLSERGYDIFKILLAFRAKGSDGSGAADDKTSDSDADDTKDRVTFTKLASDIEQVYSDDSSAPAGWHIKEQLRKELRRKVRELAHPTNIKGWQKEVPEKVEEYALRRFIKE